MILTSSLINATCPRKAERILLSAVNQSKSAAGGKNTNMRRSRQSPAEYSNGLLAGDLLCDGGRRSEASLRRLVSRAGAEVRSLLSHANTASRSACLPHRLRLSRVSLRQQCSVQLGMGGSWCSDDRRCSHMYMANGMNMHTNAPLRRAGCAQHRRKFDTGQNPEQLEGNPGANRRSS